MLYRTNNKRADDSRKEVQALLPRWGLGQEARYGGGVTTSPKQGRHRSHTVPPDLFLPRRGFFLGEFRVQEVYHLGASVNLNKTASLTSINNFLARSGFDVLLAKGAGYYYVTSDCDKTYRALSAGCHETGLYGLGPYLNQHSVRTWVEAVADKFDHEEGLSVRDALRALLA